MKFDLHLLVAGGSAINRTLICQSWNLAGMNFPAIETESRATAIATLATRRFDAVLILWVNRWQQFISLRGSAKPPERSGDRNGDGLDRNQQQLHILQPVTNLLNQRLINLPGLPGLFQTRIAIVKTTTPSRASLSLPKVDPIVLPMIFPSPPF